MALDLKPYIRTIPDFPKAGIMYRDITTLLSDPEALKAAIEQMAAPYKAARVDKVAGIDARGFIFGAALAVELGCGFVPIRKAGKLPFETYAQDYALEYGTDSLQIHSDAAQAGERLVLVDDLIATGGTALAALSLLHRTNCEIIGASFVVDLPDLGGMDALKSQGVNCHSLVEFSGH